MQMFRLIVALSCLLASCAAGRPQQKYLPPRGGQQGHHQSPHYHGVSGQAQRFSAPAATAYHGQRQAAAPQIPIVRSDYQSDANGNYNFGYETGNGIHRDETGEFSGGWPHGSLGVRGSYSYTGDDGRQYTVNYTADKNGFHAEGAHLPTSPSLPAGHHQQRSGGFGHGGQSGHGGHGGAYQAAASHVAAPATRYLPPGSGPAYRQRRNY